jgi:hypothetical protein
MFIGDISTAIKDFVEIMADVCILECGLTILPNFLILELLLFTKFANAINWAYNWWQFDFPQNSVCLTSVKFCPHERHAVSLMLFNESVTQLSGSQEFTTISLQRIIAIITHSLSFTSLCNFPGYVAWNNIVCVNDKPRTKHGWSWPFVTYTSAPVKRNYGWL